MASALMILFLGCWLAGQSGVSGGTGRAPPAAPHPRHALGEMVPGPAAVPEDARTEGTNPAETQEPNPFRVEEGTSQAPAVARHPMHALGAMVPGAATVPADARFHPIEGSNSAENQQPDSRQTESEAKGGTDPTQPRATPTPAHPGGTGPGTESGGRKSTSTPPETEGTDPAGSQQMVTPPPTTEPEGEGGTNLTRSGTTPTSPCPSGVRSGNESGGSESPSTPPKAEGTNPAGSQQMVPPPPPTEPEGEGPLEPAIIAGVSAAAAGLLLLLLAFLCYRRKGPAPRQSRESEPATTVYALMGEGKQLDVLPQKPDPGTEGHTYAELDGQALQAKQGGAAPAPEPPLYSTITMSQGPNGQSPQGAAEPPTDPDSVNPGGVTGETGQEASATTE